MHRCLKYQGYSDTQALGRALEALQAEGLDRLPLPGSGQTLERFRRLAEVAAHDVRLCKLFEGHTDALAIMAELDSPLPARHYVGNVGRRAANGQGAGVP